ncbi:MAG: hypothetical protein R3338_14385, partial [Thermoanaerobaculia bacterium]|nr:hypothetical protein [Thermoanaerobaculia bacterium]
LLEGKLYEFDSSRPVTIAATIASIGSGAFDLSARLHGWSGDRRSGTHEYGTVFILTAGVMNLLLLFDLWDLLFAEEAENEEDPEIVGESR